MEFQVVHNSIGVRWIVAYPDDIEDFTNAEDARKAAKLYNKAHGQSLARIFRKVPFKDPTEIMV